MRRLALAVAMLELLVLPVAAQTADEIITKYVNKVGGAEQIHALKTLRRTAKLTVGGGFEAALVQENKRPNMVRMDTTLQGMTGVVAYDGHGGWKIEPWMGKKDPEPLGEDELKEMLEESDFDGPLIDYEEKGNKIELMGLEPVEGTDALKLKVTFKSGSVRYYYMDTDYYVPIKIETKRLVRGAEREFESTLGDYKQVGGVYQPHSIETSIKGSQQKVKLQFEKIEANVPIDDSRFHEPGTKRRPGPAAEGTVQKRPQTMEGTESAYRPASRSATVNVDSETISGLGARNIGSAAMSGRVAALDAIQEGKRLTVYIGAASGGVWKSVNSGTTYKPVFDKQPVQSIGALAIDRKNPKTVWVGTGESWTRNSTSIGDGVYKSTDGGDNWTHLGLKESERISKIAIDPSDSNTAYVCVPGKLWSDSDERGLYKTADGGKTWTKILGGPNRSTGCSTMALDPRDSKTIYAGLWDFRRQGWTFRSGGEGPKAPSGSGLKKTTDGGATWTDLNEKTAKGLPPKPWGRLALAVAPSKPDVVYAFIEAEAPRDGLYRSEDGGRTWAALDRSQNMIWRPFYFANLIVDPKDENTIYKPGGSFTVSTDGGKSFSNISGGAHGDFHDLWINPSNTDHLIVGDDGGVWYSYDAGNRWWKAENLPISQFYHVSVDMDTPYHVCGGLQDNSSWVGDSQHPGGITNHQWENMYGGDGFWMFSDPSDPDYLYAESQGGEIGRVNRKTHEMRGIKPLPQYGEGKLRYNWNTPIHVSALQKGTVYIGSQFLFRSRDHGQSWDRISRDLTTNDARKQAQEQSGGITVDNSVAEMHTTIYAICESPRNANVIWVGTDDGNLQHTRDGGKTWTNVVGNIHGLPKSAWVSSLEASHFDEGTAYATFDLHHFGDMRPYVYKTEDHGKTWTPVVEAGGPVRGFAHVVKEDLVNRKLLFLGTELGLWVSLDGGRQWVHYTGGEFPSVPVRDLAIHPRDHDLVIATHGRGIWVIDDITPLRALTPEAVATDVAFIKTGPSKQTIPASGGWMNGDATFVGPNPTDDAVITYYQKRRHIFGDLKIEIFDREGKLLDTVPTSKRRGLNRATWSMRLKPPRVPAAATAAFGAAKGPRLLPDTYTVKLTKDRQVYTMQLPVVADPRAKHTADDRRAQLKLSMKLYHLLEDMAYTVERINEVRLALDDRAGKLKVGDPLAERLRSASSQADAVRRKIVATREGGAITGEERLREFLADLYGNVVGYEGRPSETQVQRADGLARELSDVVHSFDAWVTKELAAVNSGITKERLEPVRLLTREEWEQRTARK